MVPSFVPREAEVERSEPFTWAWFVDEVGGVLGNNIIHPSTPHLYFLYVVVSEATCDLENIIYAVSIFGSSSDHIYLCEFIKYRN